jgi:hypothetical protein
LLQRFSSSKPEGGLPIFKFDGEGDAIAARFIKRRQNIKTQLGTGSVVDVDIIERSDGGALGPHTIFESGHLTRIFDSHDLQAGDRFYLRLHEVDQKSKFKRFAFELVDGPRPPRAADDALPDEIPF